MGRPRPGPSAKSNPLQAPCPLLNRVVFWGSRRGGFGEEIALGEVGWTGREKEKGCPKQGGLLGWGLSLIWAAAAICYPNSCRPRFSGEYLVFEVIQDACRSKKENASVYWNATLSCPFTASNYANLYLVPISFWSRSGCWPCLGFTILSRFTGVHLSL